MIARAALSRCLDLRDDLSPARYEHVSIAGCARAGSAAAASGGSRMVRLYVGGLDSEVTAELLAGRFKPFGRVVSCELLPRKEGCVTGAAGGCRGFAYVELSPDGEQALNRCLSTYNGCRWRGGVLRVEKARPDFKAALQEDRQAEADAELSAAEAAADARQEEHVAPASGKPVRVMRPDRKKTVASVTQPGAGSRSVFPPFKQIPLQNIPWQSSEFRSGRYFHLQPCE